MENLLIQAELDDPVTDLTQVVTADLDGDGCLELVLPICKNKYTKNRRIY